VKNRSNDEADPHAENDRKMTERRGSKTRIMKKILGVTLDA
jgi:hypothetical protein